MPDQLRELRAYCGKRLVRFQFRNQRIRDVEQRAQAIALPNRRLPGQKGHSPRIAVPDDVEIVLYCSSRRDVVSARVAVALKRIGVENVWVLEGGLDSWREKGLPLCQFPEAPGAIAERLGVRLPDA